MPSCAITVSVALTVFWLCANWAAPKSCMHTPEALAGQRDRLLHDAYAVAIAPPIITQAPAARDVACQYVISPAPLSAAPCVPVRPKGKGVVVICVYTHFAGVQSTGVHMCVCMQDTQPACSSSAFRRHVSHQRRTNTPAWGGGPSVCV